MPAKVAFVDNPLAQGGGEIIPRVVRGSVTTPVGTFGLGVRSGINDANTNGHPRIVDQESLHTRFAAVDVYD